MQIGFDVGATKIESVILKDNGEEVDRSRRDCPKDYKTIIQTIKDVVAELEKKTQLCISGRSLSSRCSFTTDRIS